jgi:hypothetical protein
MSTVTEWIRAFEIFKKYTERPDEERFEVCAEHDELWAGPDPITVSDEDREELESLGYQRRVFSEVRLRLRVSGKKRGTDE